MSLGDCEKVKWLNGWKVGRLEGEMVGRLEGWKVEWLKGGKVEGVAKSNKACHLLFPSLRSGEWRFAQWEHG
jgi:hypothetical protein